MPAEAQTGIVAFLVLIGLAQIYGLWQWSKRRQLSQKSLNLPQSVTADLSDPLVSVELAALTPAQAIKLIQELAESALPGMLPNYYLKKLRAIAMLARIAEKMPEGQG